MSEETCNLNLIDAQYTLVGGKWVDKTGVAVEVITLPAGVFPDGSQVTVSKPVPATLRRIDLPFQLTPEDIRDAEVQAHKVRSLLGGFYQAGRLVPTERIRANGPVVRLSLTEGIEVPDLLDEAKGRQIPNVEPAEAEFVDLADELGAQAVELIEAPTARLRKNVEGIADLVEDDS